MTPPASQRSAAHPARVLTASKSLPPIRLEPGSTRRRGQRDGIRKRILPPIGAAVWQARSDPLELIALHAGDTASSFLPHTKLQLRAGSPWLESVYPPDRRKVRRFVGRLKLPPTGRSIDYRLNVPQGEPQWVRHWLVSRSPLRGGRQHLHGLLQTLPPQEQSQREAIRIEERERNRIGQELHDDLCQVLTGITCMMAVVSQRAARRAPALAAEIRDLNRSLQEATLRVRAMAHGLFPAQLDHLSLRHALAEFARQTRARYPITVAVELSGKIPPHTPDQILHLYRIAQEAVGNAVRHGRASAIHIFVAASPARMRLRIEDNGTGAAVPRSRPDGIGMRVMQCRARILAGEMRFRNLARRGAALEIIYSPTPSAMPALPTSP